MMVISVIIKDQTFPYLANRILLIEFVEVNNGKFISGWQAQQYQETKHKMKKLLVHCNIHHLK